jgi:threonine dehydratase
MIPAEHWHWTDALLTARMVSMVTLTSVLSARKVLRSRLPVAPMWSYPALNEAAHATVYVKHENAQPTGAFKVRGGLTLLAALPTDRRSAGLVTWSTGNHAQSIAYACREFGAPCTIVMPDNASEVKIRAVRLLGATVVLAGPSMDTAQERAEEIAAAENRHLVSPGDTPELIAGVATAYLEILLAEPDLDAVVVPVGSGTGAAAAALVAAHLAPTCRVIGVQSSAAPAAYESWRTGELVHRPCHTTVDGLATGRGFSMPQRLMRAG